MKYRYAMVNRPPHYGSVPPGSIAVEPCPPGNSIARHGVIVYDRALTDADCAAYELYPYRPLAEVTAAAVERLDRYGSRYAAMIRRDGPGQIRSALGGRHGTTDGCYTDIEGDALVEHIAAALLARYPA